MEDCIFCKIASGQIPSELVYEDDRVVAFKDINPGAPVHVLIIPRRHITGVSALTEQDAPLIGHVFVVAKKLAEDFGVAADGYRVVVNTGDYAGQSVHHIHFHVLGGRRMAWPPG